MECYGLIIGILFLELCRWHVKNYGETVSEWFYFQSQWEKFILVSSTAKYLCILSRVGTKIDVQHVRFFSLINKRETWGFHNN